MPKALIVDDNFYNRDVLKLALDTAGLEYDEVTNGAEAVIALSKVTYDVLLLDLAMPDMDGIGVISKLKTMPGHDDLCVIVITANPHMATPDVEDMADYLFCKPINIQLLATMLERLKLQLIRPQSRLQ